MILPAPASPTRARYRALAFGFSVAMITYLDRVCISAAAPGMMQELELSTLEMGYAFSAFALAYGIFEIPMGWLSDLHGQRRMLTRIVSCWSLFTGLTGLVSGLRSLVAVRFVFGAAEAGAFPTLSAGLARWFPREARGKVNGTMWMGARLGGALAPALAVALIGWIGWRATFFAFGAVGVVWVAAFHLWYTDDPAGHPSVNAAELEIIRADSPVRARPASIPWRRMFRQSNVWALFGMYFAASFGFYFFVTWLPTYLMREHGLTLVQSGFYATMPLGAAAASCLAGGCLSDWLVRRTGSLRWGRALVGSGGFLLGAVGFAAASGAGGPVVAIACLTAAQAALDLTVGVSWATCVEIGGPYTSTLAGFMNTASSLAAVLLPLFAAWIEGRFGSFRAVFAVAALIYFAGALLWLRIDPARRIEP